jgi:hypothetical protein
MEEGQMDFTEQQQTLVNEYERKYGNPDGSELPEGVEDVDLEYEDLLARLREVGIEPTDHGWAPAGTTKKASNEMRTEFQCFLTV